ncbi:helix-turn-helix domain-containing protein [uncultured Xylophilus sp.]|uniref:helix-turn-helix domain-containing protein n=1 Tax=uncultured Xylophilus sp. TaxID=296832 RepID=UPI0025EEB6E8|nr:helix-turn-helix domain-containing protein [uncultured Xylophilus sp.]
MGAKDESRAAEQAGGVAVVDLGALERQQADDGCQASLFGFGDALVPSAFLGSEADGDRLGAVQAIRGATDAGAASGEGHTGTIEERRNALFQIMTPNYAQDKLGKAELRAIIGSRLREERQRLNLSQADLAERSEVSRRSIVEWERGALVPTVEFIAHAAELGFDPLYVVTGQRIALKQAQVLGVQLDAAELEVVEAFRACVEDDRKVVKRIATTLGGISR